MGNGVDWFSWRFLRVQVSTSNEVELPQVKVSGSRQESGIELQYPDDLMWGKWVDEKPETSPQIDPSRSSLPSTLRLKKQTGYKQKKKANFQLLHDYGEG